MTKETEQILKELKGIKADITFIKTHIRKVDVILTDDDVESLKEAERDLKEGKTKKLI